MFELIKFVYSLLRNLTPAQKARVAAHWIVPSAILLFTTTGVIGGYFVSDTAIPVVASDLKTEILQDGTISSKPGIVLLVEPAKADFRIVVNPPPTRLWSSFDSEAARENRTQLSIDGKTVVIKAPFSGVGEPVAIVAEGAIARTIHVPGGTETIDDLLIRSKRSVTLVAGVLLVCMFAFGMSSVSGMPSLDPK